MKFSSFLTDRDKETKGIWYTVPGSDLELNVARLNNSNYETMLRKLCQPFRSLIQSGTMPAEKMNELMAQAMSHYVLLGWRKLTDDGDNEIPYSQGKALELMNESSDFFKLITDIANNADNYRREAKEALQGNSNGS